MSGGSYTLQSNGSRKAEKSEVRHFIAKVMSIAPITKSSIIMIFYCSSNLTFKNSFANELCVFKPILFLLPPQKANLQMFLDIYTKRVVTYPFAPRKGILKTSTNSILTFFSFGTTNVEKSRMFCKKC